MKATPKPMPCPKCNEPMDYEAAYDDSRETGEKWPGGYHCMYCNKSVIDEPNVDEDGHPVRALLHWERLTARDVLAALVPHGPVKLAAIERLAGDIKRAQADSPEVPW